MAERGRPEKGPLFGKRHVIVLFLFFLISIGIGMRVHLSVAIVAMTERASPNPDIPVYNWTNKSVVLSSFFWGYVVLQILAGEIGRRYGTKKVLVIAMGCNSLACIATPFFANNLGSYGVMACRALQGLAQGFFFPSTFNLLGKWCPKEERSVMGTTALIGGAFGTVVAMPMVGYISATWWGWPLSFYVHGAIGILWIVCWIWLGANSPAEHKTITKEERFYIENSLGLVEEEQQTFIDKSQERSETTEQKKYKTPFKQIFTSLPAWAIVMGHVGQHYGFTTLLTEMPTYMDKVMKFDIKKNGLLSAMPYLTCFVLGLIFSFIADYMMNHKYATRSFTRKFFNSIAFIVPSMALIILSYLPADATIASVVMLILAVGINAAINSGYAVNHMDLSPRFAGVLMGFGNSTGNLSAIIAPLVVHVIVTDETDTSLWRIVFITSALFYLAAGIFYIIFGSGEVQWWNEGADARRKPTTTRPVDSSVPVL